MRLAIIISASVLGFFLIGGSVLFFALDYGIKHPLNIKGPVETIEIPRGMGSGKIGELLEEKSIIRNRYLWYYYLWRQGVSHKLQAGEYELSAAMTISEIAEKLIVGAVVAREKKVTIPEGFTSEEIQARLKTSGFNIDIKKEMAAFGVGEGYLFPDTYFFDNEATGQEIIKKMNENFIKKIEPFRDDIKNSARTLQEIIIMASLIEEEIPHEKDRAVAAGLLWKRMDVDMPLQVDATVIYAKGIRGGAGAERALTGADLQIDSPYNTYLYKSLPPAPIANSGLSAIRAAIAPQESEYWYYLSKPDGETVFSKTLQEHNQNKAKYLR